MEVSAPPEPAAAYLEPDVPPPKRLVLAAPVRLFYRSELTPLKSVADWVLLRPVAAPNLLAPPPMKRLPAAFEELASEALG